MIKTIVKNLEKVITIQEKIIKIKEKNIKDEKLINSLLWEKYFGAWENLKVLERAYKTLMDKWLAAGNYVRDRRIYMREYMKKKRANGQIKHWRKYLEEKEKGKNVEKKKTKHKKDTRGTKLK
tara:strand:+ start:417 stop:785 length:369 start_codon:yes stop_codon:yes gene_type:complete